MRLEHEIGQVIDGCLAQCKAVSSERRPNGELTSSERIEAEIGDSGKQRETQLVAIADIYERTAYELSIHARARALNLADIFDIDANQYILHSRFMKSGINVAGCLIVVVVAVDDTQTQHIFCVNVCIVSIGGLFGPIVFACCFVLLAIAKCFSSPCVSRCLEIISIFSV